MYTVLNMYRLTGTYLKILKSTKNENVIYLLNGRLNRHYRDCKLQTFYAFPL